MKQGSDRNRNFGRLDFEAPLVLGDCDIVNGLAFVEWDVGYDIWALSFTSWE